jgi:tetratricopeptide (TPR) repeat protein
MMRARAVRGWTLQARNDLDRALLDFNAVIAAGPSDPRLLSGTLHARAGIWFDRNELDNAIADDSAAIRLLPDGGVFEDRALDFFKKGEFDKALSDLDEAERLVPAGHEYILAKRRGDNWLGKKNFVQADRYYSLALSSAPSDPLDNDPLDNVGAAYRGRGDARMGLGDRTHAAADYAATLRVNPKDTESRIRLAALQGQGAEANPQQAGARSDASPQNDRGAEAPATAIRGGELPPPSVDSATLLFVKYKPSILDDGDFWRRFVWHNMCPEAERFLGGEFDVHRNPDDLRAYVRGQLLDKAQRAPTFFALNGTGSLGTYDTAAQAFPIDTPFKGQTLLRNSQPGCENPYSCQRSLPTSAGPFVWALGAPQHSNCTRGGAATRTNHSSAGPAWPEALAGERYYFVKLDQDLSQKRVSMSPAAARDQAERFGRNLNVTIILEIKGVEAVDGQNVTLTGHVRDYRLTSAIGGREIADFKF